MGHRYRADDKFYKGCKYLDELEIYGEKLACQIFGADWASLRPLSGHIADIIAVSTLAGPNSSILSIHPDNGGYPGISDQGGYTQFLNCRNFYFPYDNEKMNINIDKSRLLIEESKPKLVIFGQSFFLFPHPISELVDSCKSAGSKIVFDGAHVLGLLAGQRFQSPLEEGAILLFGSTHKSMFGPQGGIMFGAHNDTVETVKHRIFPGLVDNAHWNRIAALVWTLDELKRNGRNYSRQVIANAKTLAKNLDEQDVPVKCAQYGYTESHQVLLDISASGQVEEFTNRLEQANIIVDHGIRLGTSEITRRGMKKAEMESIAELVGRIYKGETPSRVRRQVVKFRKQFKSIMYT